MITVNTRTLENSYTSAQWAASNPVLPDRVLGYDSTVRKYKMGDNVTHWIDLAWWSEGTTLPDITFDIPIGTTSPYVINYYDNYLAYGNRPNIWVEIYRQESPDITEEIAFPIQRFYVNDDIATVKVMFPDNPTIDHFRAVLKGG